MYIPLLLTLTTGIRISEVIAVKFSDIDWWEENYMSDDKLGRTTSNDGEAENDYVHKRLKQNLKSGERDILG